jgi:hypothetical protein
MKVAGRFLLAELMWATGIFVVMVPVALLDNDPPSTARFLWWLARAIGLAAFPAGIAIAPAVFAHARPWRPLLPGLAAAGLVSASEQVLGSGRVIGERPDANGAAGGFDGEPVIFVLKCVLRDLELVFGPIPRPPFAPDGLIRPTLARTVNQRRGGLPREERKKHANQRQTQEPTIHGTHRNETGRASQKK